MTTAAIYALIGEILRLSQGQSREVLEGALEHARTQLPPKERAIVSQTLVAWLQHQDAPPPSSLPSAASEEETSNAVNAVLDDSDPRTREVQAMLSDAAFVSSRAELMRKLATHFDGIMSVDPHSKDSQKRLVSRAVVAFAKAPQKEQANIYRALRRAYLPREDASLEGWSKIITDNKR